MRRALGGDLSATTRATWDRLCQQYSELALGSPDGITWRDVLIPFGISLDNAPIQLAYRKEALLPRLSRLQEFTTLFEHAITGLNFNIEDHVKKEVKRETWKRKQQLANNSKWSESKKVKPSAAIALLTHMLQRYRSASAKFYVDCQFNNLVSDEARIVTPVFKRVLHGESNTSQASPRTPTQRTFQPQEAVQPQRNQTILQPYTPAQKANRKSQTTPKNGHTPRRMKPTHTRLTYTRMRPHAPSHQAGDHPVPAHTERHNPPKLRTQRQSGLPPRAASSQGQRHRCRSIRKQSV